MSSGHRSPVHHPTRSRAAPIPRPFPTKPTPPPPAANDLRSSPASPPSIAAKDPTATPRKSTTARAAARRRFHRSDLPTATPEQSTWPASTSQPTVRLQRLRSIFVVKDSFFARAKPRQEAKPKRRTRVDTSPCTGPRSVARNPPCPASGSLAFGGSRPAVSRPAPIRPHRGATALPNILGLAENPSMVGADCKLTRICVIV